MLPAPAPWFSRRFTCLSSKSGICNRALSIRLSQAFESADCCKNSFALAASTVNGVLIPFAMVASHFATSPHPLALHSRLYPPRGAHLVRHCSPALL
nr:MAG TPA: hypothetical protein [Bacteriophage sp.]